MLLLLLGNNDLLQVSPDALALPLELKFIESPLALSKAVPGEHVFLGGCTTPSLCQLLHNCSQLQAHPLPPALGHWGWHYSSHTFALPAGSCLVSANRDTEGKLSGRSREKKCVFSCLHPRDVSSPQLQELLVLLMAESLSLASIQHLQG